MHFQLLVLKSNVGRKETLQQSYSKMSSFNHEKAEVILRCIILRFYVELMRKVQYGGLFLSLRTVDQQHFCYIFSEQKWKAVDKN